VVVVKPAAAALVRHLLFLKNEDNEDVDMDKGEVKYSVVED
jgi:hypothetical protein